MQTLRDGRDLRIGNAGHRVADDARELHHVARIGLLHLDERAYGPHGIDVGAGEANLVGGDRGKAERLPQTPELVRLDAGLAGHV